MRHSMHTNHSIFCFVFVLAMFRISNSNFNGRQNVLERNCSSFGKFGHKEMEFATVHSTKQNSILKFQIHRLFMDESIGISVQRISFEFH